MQWRQALAVVLWAGALAGAPSGSLAEWGADEDRAAGEELLADVRIDLAAIRRAPEAERAERIARFAKDQAADEIEAVKRFRDPEFLPLFRALLDHPDWHVAHRALFALERMGDGVAFGRAWALLAHSEARMRERAALACLVLWDRPGAEPPTDAPAALAARIGAEPDPHVRAALAALARRAGRELVVERMCEEARVRGGDGLLVAPLLRKMGSAARAAPGHVIRYASRTSDASAATLPVAPRWTAPLLRFGEEAIPPGFLQPFGHLRNGGATVHTGSDVGAFLDGAGLYACADGVVRHVQAGTDTGTMIVLEHRVATDELATILYMHAGDVLFAKAGDRVEAGQLIGEMGMGFSFENGGHYAHLHLGVCPGAFSIGHVYGYKAASDGLADWFDPIAFLAARMIRPTPPR